MSYFVFSPLTYRLVGIALFLTLAALAGVGALRPDGNRALHPVVDVQTGYLVGASLRGRWVKPETAGKSMRGTERYRVYSFDGRLGEVKGTKPKAEGAPCPETLYVKFHPVSKPWGKPGVFAIGGDWNAIPRAPQKLGTTSPVYREIVAGILKKHGISRPVVNIDQLIRADLNGDGEPEILISANRNAGHGAPFKPVKSDASAGDYSIVLLRQIVKGRVVTSMLHEEYYPTAKEFNAPEVSRIMAILDFNGDGKMEVAVESRYYEGDSVSIFEVANGKSTAVLTTGCGA